MSAVEKHDPSVRPQGSAQSAGSKAGASGPGSEPEITPLPAPMPGLSMELEAVEPEEPSLAPLAKLPGVVARPGPNKKLKATPSTSGKPSAGTKPKAKASEPEKTAKSEANVDAKKEAKNKASSTQKTAGPASGQPLASPASTQPSSGQASTSRKVTDPEPLSVSAPTASNAAQERGRAWWVIGALGLVALGAGVGALLWQPSSGPVVPSLPEQPVTPPAAPPRTVLTVQPIAPPPSGSSGPAPVVEALPVGPTAAAGGGTGTAVPSPTPAVTGPKSPTKPVADSSLHAVRTTSKPETAASPGSVASKPTPETKPPAAKPTVKPAAKPAAVASAPLSLEPVPQLSPPIIRQHMLVAERRFPSCVREGFGSNVSIGIIVEANGTVRKADILGPLGPSATGRCISDQIRGLHFPPFTEGGATKFFVWSYQVPQAK